jgi:hypothetical protein
VIHNRQELIDLGIADAPVRFQAVEPPWLDLEQRAVMDALRYRLPEAKVTARVHQARVDHPRLSRPIMERYGMVASIQFGPFELRREYAF